MALQSRTVPRLAVSCWVFRPEEAPGADPEVDAEPEADPGADPEVDADPEADPGADPEVDVDPSDF